MPSRCYPLACGVDRIVVNEIEPVLRSLLSGLCPSLRVVATFALQTKGCAVVADPEKDKQLVEFLLGFKDSSDLLLREAFQRNEAFAYAAKRAFERVINSKENRPAELIGASLMCLWVTVPPCGVVDQRLLVRCLALVSFRGNSMLCLRLQATAAPSGLLLVAIMTWNAAMLAPVSPPAVCCSCLTFSCRFRCVCCGLQPSSWIPTSARASARCQTPRWRLCWTE